MSKFLRGFGAALFISGAALYFMPTTSSTGNDKALKNAEKEIATLEQQLKTHEQTIDTLTAENEQLMADIDRPAEKATETAAKEDDKKPAETTEQADEEAAIQETLYIYEGMSLYDIGKKAEDLGLVKVGRELELFLSKKEYARYIQKGAFELTSTMTYTEMADIITGQNE